MRCARCGGDSFFVNRHDEVVDHPDLETCVQQLAGTVIDMGKAIRQLQAQVEQLEKNDADCTKAFEEAHERISYVAGRTDERIEAVEEQIDWKHRR